MKAYALLLLLAFLPGAAAQTPEADYGAILLLISEADSVAADRPAEAQTAAKTFGLTSASVPAVKTSSFAPSRCAVFSRSPAA
jgi:hypothetical protein